MSKEQIWEDRIESVDRIALVDELVEKIAQGEITRLAVLVNYSREIEDLMIGFMYRTRMENAPHVQIASRRIRWKNNGVAEFYSAADPGRLRGPMFDAGLVLNTDPDNTLIENCEAFNMLMFGLRIREPKLYILNHEDKK